MLVGGGELHERWETLLTVRAPLSRGIQRFTGITQAMVDEAPPAEGCPSWPRSCAGACSWPIARRSTAASCARPSSARACAGRTAQLCTVALARRLVCSGASAGCAALAESLGIEVEVSHRASADAETCARVFRALFPRLCAHAITVRDALDLVRPRARGGRGRRPPTGRPGRAGRAGACPTSAT